MVGRPSNPRAGKTSPSTVKTSKSRSIGITSADPKDKLALASSVGRMGRFGAASIEEGEFHALAADQGRTVRLITKRAGLHGRSASGALGGGGCLVAHGCSPAIRVTSFCSSKPTSRPSEVVTGALSSWCSAMNRAISLIKT